MLVSAARVSIKARSIASWGSVVGSGALLVGRAGMTISQEVMAISASKARRRGRSLEDIARSFREKHIWTHTACVIKQGVDVVSIIDLKNRREGGEKALHFNRLSAHP
jgi:hypothetical protein